MRVRLAEVKIGPECALDRRTIDAVVLVVHAVVGEQRVDLVSEVLEKGRVAEKAHVPVDGPGVEPNEHCTLREHRCNE